MQSFFKLSVLIVAAALSQHTCPFQDSLVVSQVNLFHYFAPNLISAKVKLIDNYCFNIKLNALFNLDFFLHLTLRLLIIECLFFYYTFNFTFFQSPTRSIMKVRRKLTSFDAHIQSGEAQVEPVVMTLSSPQPQPLPSPNTTVNSITRELEETLFSTPPVGSYVFSKYFGYLLKIQSLYSRCIFQCQLM